MAASAFAPLSNDVVDDIVNRVIVGSEIVRSRDVLGDSRAARSGRIERIKSA